VEFCVELREIPREIPRVIPRESPREILMAIAGLVIEWLLSGYGVAIKGLLSG